jgi:hypothetical protein
LSDEFEESGESAIWLDQKMAEREEEKKQVSDGVTENVLAPILQTVKNYKQNRKQHQQHLEEMKDTTSNELHRLTANADRLLAGFS